MREKDNLECTVKRHKQTKTKKKKKKQTKTATYTSYWHISDDAADFKTVRKTEGGKKKNVRLVQATTERRKTVSKILDEWHEVDAITSLCSYTLKQQCTVHAQL